MTDVSEWIDKLVQETKENLDVSDNITDSSEQARRLLEVWSLQTDNFSSFGKKEKKSESAGQKQKVVIYRKLDAPMMVTKKISERPSVDPTLIMEARRQHVVEMREKRLERQFIKANTPKPLQPADPVKVEIPNIDTDVKSYKQRLTERIAAKQKELDDKKRQSMQIKAIEESVQRTIANEAKQKAKEIEKEAKVKAQQNEQLKLRLELLYRAQSLRFYRIYFSIWSGRCIFKSQAFERATTISNFQKKSYAFSRWRKSYIQRIRQKDIEKLEQRLRLERYMEDESNRLRNKNLLHNHFVKWKARYKTSVEMKILEEQHKKRRELLINRIEEKIIEADKLERKKKLSADPSPKTNKTIVQQKSKPIKIDPKAVAMEKRQEEMKQRKLEKLQKEALASQEAEQQKIKLELEEQRKKRNEHRAFLESEKKKREEQHRAQLEYEKCVQRKKYIDIASKEFRITQIQRNAIRQWSKINEIKKTFSANAIKTYICSLLKKAFKSLICNMNTANQEREDKALYFFYNNSVRYFLLSWTYFHQTFIDREGNLNKVSNMFCMKKHFNIIIEERNKKRKARLVQATHHFNKQVLRRFFKAWPEGCAALREEERRERDRQALMCKAIKMFDELTDDDF